MRDSRLRCVTHVVVSAALCIPAMGCAVDEDTGRGSWPMSGGHASRCEWYEAGGEPCPDAPGEDAGTPRGECPGHSHVDCGIVVSVGDLEVEVETLDGPRVVRVPVPVVEVEVSDAPEGVVPMRARTPVIEIELPIGPPSRMLPPVTEVEVEDRCPSPGPRRARVPVVEVDLGDITDGAPRRMRAPVIEIDPAGEPGVVVRRVRIPAIEQEVPDGAGGVMRVRTPAFEAQVPSPEEDVPTRVRVRVPSLEEEAGVRRIPVPVTPQCEG